ncbi:MAG: phage major capsid protein, partial [Limisphaerales bacterium]
VATLGLQTPTIAGLLPETETNARTIRYIREKSFTNSAAAVAENGTKPEASWDLEEIDEQVRKIAVIGRVTDEFVDDFPAVRDYVNNRLRFMVLGCEDDQLLNGNGEGVNLRGILNTPGIQTQAKGSDSNLDAIHKAITKVKTVGFLFPTAIAVHPEDWEILRLMRDDTANYYSGGPFAAVDNVLWGLPVVKTTRIARGTALVGDFVRGGQIFRRQGLTFEMSNTDADNFSKNLITFRAETRLALAIYRPLAFCTVTGIA